MYIIQHCFICVPSDSTVSEDARIEPKTVATLALTAGRSNHLARSHPHLARSHPHLARSHPHLARSHSLLYGKLSGLEDTGNGNVGNIAGRRRMTWCTRSRCRSQSSGCRTLSQSSSRISSISSPASAQTLVRLTSLYILYPVMHCVLNQKM
jgi:hypothetical protein